MIEIVDEGFLDAVACCNIDPALPNCYDLVDAELKHIHSGTSKGWEVIRPNHPILLLNVTWDEVKPVPCEQFPGHWHYAVIT